MTSKLILFANDWERTNAVVHDNTTNRSFVQMAYLLKSMGIRNNTFFLALINADLKKVDPFAPDISEEEIGLIAAEVAVNPWYFFREIARAPGESGAPARMLKANRGNIALFWTFFNHVMVLLIQIRQTGKSFNSDILATGLMQIWCRNTQINLLTLGEKLRKINILRIRRIMDALPRYLDMRTAKDLDNSEAISVKQHANYYYSHLPRADPDAAGTLGRGLTSPIFFIDEAPFQPNIHESLPAAFGAGGAAIAAAKASGAPWGSIITTTAGKKDTTEGAFIYKFMSGMAQWTEAFYDAKDEEDLYAMVRANSRDKELRINITLNHNQLGETDEWLREKISASVASSDKADRDFFNRWTAGTATNPLTIKQLETIRRSEREPYFRETSEVGRYQTNWYIHQHEVEQVMTNDPTLVVFDTSEASGGDDISMRVTNMRTGSLLASAMINNTNIITFAEWVSTWLTRWSKTTMLIERRSTGSAVIDMLLLILPSKGIDPFTRLYNKAVNNPEEYKQVWETLNEPVWRRPADFLDLNKKLFGFPTSGSGTYSRGTLYSQILNQAAQNLGHLVVDRVTVNQITSLITRNGRVDHPPGEHDDMVISWLLTNWFMTKATNLKHYGIDSAIILRDLKVSADIAPIDRLRSRQQQQLKARAKELADSIRSTPNETIIRMHEQELRMVYSRIEVTDTEKISVDNLITSLREERTRTRISSSAKVMDERDKEIRNWNLKTDRIKAQQGRLFQPTLNTPFVSGRYI